MNLGISKKHIRVTLGVLASSVLVLFFQNCGKAGFDADLESSGSFGMSDAALTAKYGASAASKVQSAPFGFDVDVDTITYNSCADPSLKNYGTRGFFSIMMGSYSTGGVRINQQFFDYVDSNFSPIYGNSTISENQYKSILADSPANAGALPTAAVRVKNSLTDIYADGSLLIDKDIIPMSANLTHSLLLDTLFTNYGSPVSYFPFAPERRNFEAKLTFNTDEFQADTFRSLLATDAILAVTFLLDNSKEIYRIRPDSGYPATRAYGKAYSMAFVKPIASGVPVHESVPTRIVGGIEVINLESGQKVEDLNNCRYYTIVRKADAATYCPAMTQSQMNSHKAELMKLRRHLRADHWDVNPAMGCVVPKHTSCYKEENLQSYGLPEVLYDPSIECHSPTNTSQIGTPIKSKCAHYISVCTKD